MTNVLSRRDFLAASAAAAALASLPAGAVSPASASGLWPRQEMLRNHAFTSELMFVCWGNQSGKTELARTIYRDRVEVLRHDPQEGGADIFLVAQTREQARVLFSTHRAPGVRTHRVSIRKYLQILESPGVPKNIDSVFFDEADWMSISASEILSRSVEPVLYRSRLKRPFMFFCGGPSSPTSSLLGLVQNMKSSPVAGIVADHASTWEVNPRASHAELLPERVRFPRQWDRDFAAYREPYHEARLSNSI